MITCSLKQIGPAGKTKILFEHPYNPGQILVRNTDYLTRFDDPGQTVVMPGKAALCTSTTTAIFKYLRVVCGLPIAFCGPWDETTFIAPLCDMIKVEVVVRNFSYGSYAKRYPGCPKGTKLHEPVAEFFLKTKNHKFGDLNLPVDDPYIELIGDETHLFLPGVPMNQQGPFAKLLSLPAPLSDRKELIGEMRSISLAVNDTLKTCFNNLNLGFYLVDIKLEFGIDPTGQLLVADVIDCDSCRVITINSKGEWEHNDKELFRMGRPMKEIWSAYDRIARLVQMF